MPFRPGRGRPEPRPSSDPRFADLFQDDPETAHLLLAGVPYDASVLGRKGAREGPRAIREALWFLSPWDPGTGTDLRDLRLFDHGDVDHLDPEDVLATHETVRHAVAPLFATGREVVLLGGDHGLTFPHIQALADLHEGAIGIVVLDAHYDLRSYEVQPSSGTPFRRVLTELEGRVRGRNLAEIGIRPFANTSTLGDFAKAHQVTVLPMQDVRRLGIRAAAEQALEAAGDGTEHLWMSVDIDGLDQSIAPGCSAPGAGGLTFEEADHVVQAVAADSRCRGMDILEVAPSLDPTGNTARTAAQLIASYAGAAWRRFRVGPGPPRHH